jgi:hypothetical protein
MKKPAYKVTRPDIGSSFCIFRNWEDVECEFDGAEEGDVIHIQLVMMTDEEYDNLPDFEGW